MSLLSRNEKVALGQAAQGTQSGVVSLQRLGESNPLSPDFLAGVGDTPKELYKYLLFCQCQAFGKTVVDQYPGIPRIVFLRNFKLLLKKYPPDSLKRSIKYASLRCRQPYTTRIIAYFCGKYFDDQANCSASRQKSGRASPQH